MSRTNHITEAYFDALIDGELVPAEHARVEAHLASCEACREALHHHKQVQDLWVSAWHTQIDDATDSIDWGRFEARVMADIEQEEFCTNVDYPCEPAAPAVGHPAAAPQEPAARPWHQRLRSWLKAHPGLLIASAATAGIFLILALPALDPGPKEQDKTVIRVIKNKGTKVSVLRSPNQATGRSMTVIVVKEPPSERHPKAPPHRAKASPHKPR